jgi:hypothetical protein
MLPERLVYVVAGSRRPGACRDCGKAIEWVVNANGKNVPLNPNALVLRYDRNAGGVKFEVVSPTAVHFATCPRRRDRVKRPRMFSGRTRA